MRTRKWLIGLSIATVIVTALLISLEAYYVAAALFAGALLIGYREVWSLITTRQLLPLDERVREINSKAVRNGFIFFIAALVVMLLPFTSGMIERPDAAQVLGGLLLAGAFSYFISYIYYDRVEPKLSRRKLKLLKIFILTSVLSVSTFILGVFIHNAFDALFGVEEPVFFILAVIVAPFGLGVSLMGSLVLYLSGLFSRMP